MPTVENENATIYYEAHGAADAPALVFAHGAGGNRLSWWQQVPHFEDRHRVLTLDHRSFGRSRCAPEDFHPRHFTGDLLAILDAEGIDRAVVVGQSMGGWTALPAARRHPDRIRGIVLCGTPGGIFTERVGQALVGIGKRIGGEGVQANAALAPDYPKREPAMAHLYEQISALNTGVDMPSLGTLFATDARIAPDDLAGHSTPTAVFAGEHDLLFPLELMQEVAELLPGAVLREFPGCGHSTYFEDPGAFNRHLDAFLSGLPA